MDAVEIEDATEAKTAGDVMSVGPVEVQQRLAIQWRYSQGCGWQPRCSRCLRMWVLQRLH